MEAALARGDVCVAAFEANQLVSYNWRAVRGPVRHTANWEVIWDPGLVYRYKALTMPDYRGLHINETLAKTINRHLAKQGYLMGLSFVECTNLSSMRTLQRKGGRATVTPGISNGSDCCAVSHCRLSRVWVRLSSSYGSCLTSARAWRWHKRASPTLDQRGAIWNCSRRVQDGYDRGGEMESPNRSRALLALVGDSVVGCSVWLVVGPSRVPKTSAIAERIETIPRVETRALQPAHRSVALGALNRTAPVLGD